ncbi:Hypothetical protein, putative [Bodo saltans]|uniref:Uncharacterized protein n=1 Tax=Bodo saltans TaxID=75058 RepID=A0A0S4JB18_BODSA|nr:Hypothetical protein, putative [Bodo saltans]|eukprot:CUG87261.1 Hypothetical protein, putative [Bodo saltans]
MPQSTPPSAIKRAASPRQQQSPSEIQQSSRLRHDPVNDGADNWLKVKEHYNSYIRSGASAAAAEAGGADSPARASSALRKAALETPKYVLGKLVSKVKSGQPSSSFHPSANGTVMYVREPMPAERRKYAPWSQNGINAAHVFESPSRRSGTPTRSGQDGAVSASSVATNIPSSYVGKRIIVMDAKSDPRHQTAIRIVDGGDITMIQDDPRDIGYASRNIQKSGGAGVRPSAGFASNTEREVRWGTDASNQLARTAQAPPPGTYTVLSPFDVSVRKAQAASRSTTATGKKCFGSSGSSRSTNVVVENNVPGPGFYEIP